MKVSFDKSFLKSLDRLTNDSIKNRTASVILEIEVANSIIDIQNIKKMTGYKDYYRIRIGDYRLGLEVINKESARLIVIDHRKDIYKQFPK